MRTALNRIAACSLAAAALASCSYDAITNGALEINITGMPLTAIRAELVITPSADPGNPIMREPHFGAGVYTSQALVLTLPAIPTGAFAAQVTAYDQNATPLAVGNKNGTFTPSTSDAGTLPVVFVGLSASGLDGTYGAPCVVTGSGPDACSGGLVCKVYSGGTDVGVCTHACSAGTPCDAVPPGSSCEAFAGVAANTFCQWECGTADGGDCPPTLHCGPAQASSGGKRFCQGSL